MTPLLRVAVFTIFPDLVTAHADAAIIGRARERALVDIGIPRSPGAHHRCPPDRGRRALRRGRGDGHDARSGVRIRRVR